MIRFLTALFEFFGLFAAFGIILFLPLGKTLLAFATSIGGGLITGRVIESQRPTIRTLGLFLRAVAIGAGVVILGAALTDAVRAHDANKTARQTDWFEGAFLRRRFSKLCLQVGPDTPNDAVCQTILTRMSRIGKCDTKCLSQIVLYVNIRTGAQPPLAPTVSNKDRLDIFGDD